MKKAIIILGIVCLVVAILILAYIFLVQPALSKYVLDKQQEAYTVGLMYAQNFILNEIEKNLVEKSYVQITFPDNKTAYLASINPATIPANIGGQTQ